jgi:hypothetical protein
MTRPEPDIPASIARNLSAPWAATRGPIAYLPEEPSADDSERSGRGPT